MEKFQTLEKKCAGEHNQCSQVEYATKLVMVKVLYADIQYLGTACDG